MTTLEPRRCTAPGCPGRILFPAHARTGRPAPVDAEPVTPGNIDLDQEAGTFRIVTGAELAAAHAEGRKLWISHFATCTDPAAFRQSMWSRPGFRARSAS
jgi:hypothetical protein